MLRCYTFFCGTILLVEFECYIFSVWYGFGCFIFLWYVFYLYWNKNMSECFIKEGLKLD
jgi:hypothetical protein